MRTTAIHTVDQDTFAEILAILSAALQEREVLPPGVDITKIKKMVLVPTEAALSVDQGSSQHTIVGR